MGKRTYIICVVVLALVMVGVIIVFIATRGSKPAATAYQPPKAELQKPNRAVIEELRKNVLEAVTAYFFDTAVPQRIRLRFVRDEVVAVA